MKSTTQKIISLLLTISTLLSVCAFQISADDATQPTTLWKGDDIAVDIATGKNGYMFRSVYGPAYEMSNHMVSANGGEHNDIPQTLIMVDASKDYTWSPNGIYSSFDENNYEILYCCDAETGYDGGIYYKRTNLEDSNYYTEEEAAHIRAIVTNSYPYISLEEMKKNLAEDGFEGAEDLDRAEIITAVQAAIWYYANGEEFVYSRTFNVSKNSQWGSVMHDYTSEMSSEIAALGKRKFLEDEAVANRINSLIDYLKKQDKVYAEKGQVVISGVDIVSIVPNDRNDGTYSVDLKIALNNSGSSNTDSIKLDTYLDGQLYTSNDVTLGVDEYIVTVVAKPGQTIKAIVSGTQVLPKGVYFYEPEAQDTNGDGVATSREVSQNMVGVASGVTAVYSEDTIRLTPELKGDKTAQDIGKNRFEVNIKVPGNGMVEKHDEVILMVDGSYSGDKEWPAMKDAINAIGKAILNGRGDTQLTLMAFGMGDNIVLEHVKDADLLSTVLGELPGYLLRGVSSTNCEAGFTGVAEYLENHDNTLKDAIVIYITDGGINTDETPRLFYKWQDYARNPANVINYALMGVPSEGMENATEEEKIAFVNDLWKAVFEHSGMDINGEYPISEMERAFLQYDEDFGTNASYSFLIAMKNSAYDSYPNRWNRTYDSVFALAEVDKVKDLYLVRYQNDNRATWMPDAAAVADNDNIHYVKSDSISTLTEALSGTISELAKTPYKDVVVTDYMSKWVILDPTTIKVVDGNGNVVAEFDADNSPKDENGNYTSYLYKWVGEALCKEKAPIVLDLIPESEYAAGGPEVVGNVDGDIYRITWNLKDGPLMRSDVYVLQYEVIANTAEPGFVFGKEYPANGNTYIEYDVYEIIIEVPDINADKLPISVSGTKTWNDNNDQDGLRPEFITINLLANGVKVDEVKVSADENGEWKFTFTDLPKYENGVEINYTVTEEAVEGYTTEIDGYNVINTHVPEQAVVSITKIWDDDDNSAGLRPDSIIVELYANGELIATREITEADGWVWSFNELPKYENGVEIEYTVKEVEIADYFATVEGNAAEGFTITNTYLVEMPDNPPPLAPPTGDTAILTASIAAIASILLAAFVLNKKKTVA